MSCFACWFSHRAILVYVVPCPRFYVLPIWIAQFNISGNLVEDVAQFEYLGSFATTEGSTTIGIANRLKKGRCAFANLNKISRSRGLLLNTY